MGLAPFVLGLLVMKVKGAIHNTMPREREMDTWSLDKVSYLTHPNA